MILYLVQVIKEQVQVIAKGLLSFSKMSPTNVCSAANEVIAQSYNFDVIPMQQKQLFL